MTSVQMKYVPPGRIHKLRQSQRNADIQIGAAGGCFDILHAGHVRFLEEASNHCDSLFVCLNSDRSVRKLKGEGRPINCENDRIEVLAALEVVRYIVVFDQETPDEILDYLKPKIWFKGGDYAGKHLPEQQMVEQNGGKVMILPYLDGRSTTDIIQRANGMHLLGGQNG